MHNYKKTIPQLLFIFFFLTHQAHAEDNWWDQGLNLLKSVGGEEKIAEELSNSEIGEAFKQALRIGSENVVNQLGAEDGFNNDSEIHIPLPEQLQTVKKMLATIGMSSTVDDLELKLNRAAEAATPKAKELFLQSISEMSFEDIKAIYAGPKDSATQYFKKKMTPSLQKEMGPIVSESLSQVGAIQSFDTVMGKYQALPFVPDVKANLTDYVIEKGMDGIFHYIGKEEIAIRSNPVKQTTDLLKKVFSAAQ